jgi:hypothetical protein
MSRMRNVIAVGIGLVLVCPVTARAQDRPFVFSFFAPTAESKPHVLVDYGVGVGEQSFHQNLQRGPEQRIGVQASSGRLTLLGYAGVASTAGNYDTSSQAELLVSPFRSGPFGLSLAVGGGMLHEAGGTNVLVGRVALGRERGRTRLNGNVIFQKAFQTGRDGLDLITTAGWAVRVNDVVSFGAEMIAEDLEGFWDPNEAEGGARLLVGPSLHVSAPGRRWQVTIAGGPSFHPTRSNNTSDAIRDLPQTTPTGTGYAARMSFACRF